LMAMIEQNVPIRERLDRTLQHGPFTLYVARSSLDELHKLAQQKSPKQDTFRSAWQWGLDECDMILEKDDIPDGDLSEFIGDNDDLSPPGRDVVSLITAKAQYFVCSQDEVLLDVLRNLGTAPLMRISRGVFLMENPSKSSQKKQKYEEGAKWTVAGTLQDQEKNLVSLVKENQRREREKSQHQSQERFDQQRPRYKKAKGPNPLSCKKKKREDTTSKQQSDGSEKKRKRRRKERETA